MQIKGTYKEIFIIAYPIVFGSLAQSITQVVDTAFLGRVGEVELGAGNLGGMYYLVLLLIAMGFTRGSQIIISRRTGAAEYREVGKAFDHMLILSILVIAVFLMVVIFFTDEVLGLILRSEDVFLSGMEYIEYRKYGLPTGIINFCFVAFYTGIGRTKIVTAATVVLAVVNILFDWLLIFGNLGMPRMGIGGAALASSLADFSMMMVYILFTWRKGYHRQFFLLKMEPFDRGLFRRMVTLSMPLVVQSIIGLSSWQTFFILVEKLGVRELAISSIIKSLYMLIGIPAWGLASSANTVISNILGQKKPEQVIPAMRKILNMSLAFGLSAALLMFLFPEMFLRIYTNDIALIRDSIPTYHVTLVALCLFSVGMVLLHAIMGVGDTRMILIMEAVCVVFYLSFLFLGVYEWNFSLAAIWTSEILYWGLVTLISIAYIRRKTWFYKDYANL